MRRRTLMVLAAGGLAVAAPMALGWHGPENPHHDANLGTGAAICTTPTSRVRASVW